MTKPILGVQLFTLRDYCKNPVEFADTLKYIESLDCDLVQISGVGRDEPISAESQKASLAAANDIEVCVTHTPWKRIIEETDAVIAEHKLIGCRCIGLGCPEVKYRDTVENVELFLNELKPALEKIKANGMFFNYHNHDFEFTPLDNGVLHFDYLMENTDPEVFHFTPDVGWIDFAGYDPVEYLNRLAGRVDVCHFKDYKIIDGERKFVTLGEGEVDFNACYDACLKLGVPYIVYEQDCDWVNDDAKLATKLSLDFMRKLAATF